jgi:hypothetical protein
MPLTNQSSRLMFGRYLKGKVVRGQADDAIKPAIPFPRATNWLPIQLEVTIRRIKLKSAGA